MTYYENSFKIKFNPKSRRMIAFLFLTLNKSIKVNDRGFSIIDYCVTTKICYEI